MLLSRIPYIAVLILLLVGLAPPAHSQQTGEELQALLEARDADIKRLLGDDGSEVPQSRQDELRDVVNDFLDFPAMAEAALGPHWADLSAQEQTDFVSVFSEIVRGQSLSNLDPYRAAVSYESIDVEGDNATVTTNTVYDEVPMVVVYNLHRMGDDWRATDIILDEVSTVDGYARSFRTMIRKRGFPTLMERLEKRRDQMQAG